MKYLILLTVLFLSGCEEDPNRIEVSKPVEKQPTKWKVVSEGWFKAGYENNGREILRLTSPDGRVYIGITGVGITEFRQEHRDDHTVTKEE